MLGRELLDIFPVAFLPENHALAIAIMSYNGKIDFGLLGDYDSMEDVTADRRGDRGRGQAAARGRQAGGEEVVGVGLGIAGRAGRRHVELSVAPAASVGIIQG